MCTFLLPGFKRTLQEVAENSANVLAKVGPPFLPLYHKIKVHKPLPPPSCDITETTFVLIHISNETQGARCKK